VRLGGDRCLLAFHELRAKLRRLMTYVENAIKVLPGRADDQLEGTMTAAPRKLPANDDDATGAVRSRQIESVGAILDRTTEAAIAEWYSLVQKESLLMSIPMSCEHRCGHLPHLFHDLVIRLGSSTPACSKESLSSHAVLHGIKRRKSGYTAEMLVEESRMLQVSIFHTLHNNLANIDFSLLLIGVATIADEVDSQLSQAIESFANSDVREGQLGRPLR